MNKTDFFCGLNLKELFILAFLHVLLNFVLWFLSCFVNTDKIV